MSASITAYISSPDNKYLCIQSYKYIHSYFSLVAWERGLGSYLVARFVYLKGETSESRFQVYDNVFAQLTCATKSRTIEFLFVLIQLHIASADGIVFRCCGTTAKAL